ncbi:uncharacterized protein N7482_000839 [Penicillium canariense]|uniref:FAD-binding domain-containing protein n=1 Tax=Penicillium canariense TaxID=189055 RepID=A0A9W9LTI8_9EURO|nr:uncharacterized protein N7482_000839 [Penicillium canariense]KAJ5174962.1 hypothetical protein N7482_000839 [Penicillium canariense]
MNPRIAIIGAGPSGLALAGLLERQGIDYVVYERSSAETPPRGGCLDIHRSSGQDALKEAGCFEEFKKYARYGDATIHSVWDYQGNQLFTFGEGRDSPEIDRTQLKQVLLSVIPTAKMRWSAGVEAANRNGHGDVVLIFTDGTTVSGFDLVVGADGAWSKIRPLVTAAEPKYSGIVFLTLLILPSHNFYPTVEQIAGHGPMIVFGREKLIWIQRQGDGHYRLDVGWKGPADFPVGEKFDMVDENAVKEFLLQDQQFGCHSSPVKAMIEAATGPFRTWPLHYVPPEELNWTSASGVVLIGDAAHVTTPFVGDGVNCALRDSLVLSRKLKEFGVTRQAVARYEADMFPYARDMITRSLAAGELCFEWDSPRGFMKMMASDEPLVKMSLDY